MSEEYITKNQALTMTMAVIEGDESEEVLDALQRASDNITSLPCADVAPVVHGHWIFDLKLSKAGKKYYWCSNCHINAVNVDFDINRIRYCMFCGAKMDEEAQHEEKANA